MKIHGMTLNHLSYSSFYLWRRCPREWLLKYKYATSTEIDPALPFGTAMHRSVQQALLDGGVTNETAEMFGRRLQQALIESKMRLSANAFTNLKDMGYAMLSDHTAQFILNSIHIPDDKHVERKISFDVPGVEIPVIGYIDLIDNIGQLYDIKTSKWGWDDEQAQTEFQPDFYLTAMDDLGDSRHGGMFNHVVMVKNTNAPATYILTTYRGTDYRERVYAAIQEMWEGIKSEAWKSPPTAPCSTCKLLPRCIDFD